VELRAFKEGKELKEKCGAKSFKEGKELKENIGAKSL
jgi:hypothetical protein